MEEKQQIIIDQMQKVLASDASFSRKLTVLENLARHGKKIEADAAMLLIDSAILPDVPGVYF